METVNTIIIGSSAAGLACAAKLKKRGVQYKIIEKHSNVAHAWRNHYDRLHLHTNKNASNLPFVEFPKQTPKYPTRLQIVQYLENYYKALDIRPSFNVEAKKIQRADSVWVIQTNKGIIKSKNVIVCTGNTNIPKKYSKQGLESFSGKVLHSSEYKNGKEFNGKKVLVVGFGNSVGEIAMCLHEHGAKPTLSVHSPVNVIPRDILGIPALQIGIWQSKLPVQLADRLNQPLIRFLIGNVEKYGLKKLPYGPIEQIVKHHQIPLLDIGTIDLIKQGQINVLGDVYFINKDMIQFEDNTEERFDAIILAIGYETGLNHFIAIDATRQADIKQNILSRKQFGKDNLYFCGFYVAPTGMLREIALESEIIADRIQKVNH